MEQIAIVGLGYVGLPLAAAFGKLTPTIGFDLSPQKIESYKAGVDPSGTVSRDELRAAGKLVFTGDAAALKNADFIIVAVPTPIDHARQPDFSPLIGASESIGRNMKRGVTVIFES